MKKISFWKVLKFLAKSLGVLCMILLLLILLFKWLPIYFTPTMLFRSLEAMQEGKDARIYYQWVDYDQIANPMKVAVVASEDQRFPQHQGLDFEAIAQAMEENKSRARPRGASTISQQVAKNVFLWQGGGYVRKALEVPITYLIEGIWGKQRILEVYLNIAELGPQTFGVQAAAKRYFGKEADALSQAESALLA
ncbi:MAG: monofunctional biosynthetic peptidoglycan transglycosylase, partial [Bacteroidota bacterium]